MERTALESIERDYENRTQVFRQKNGGEFRIGWDGQIVCNETHVTLANRGGARQWIAKYAHKADKARATQATRPADAERPSPIDDIHLRKNIYR